MNKKLTLLLIVIIITYTHAIAYTQNNEIEKAIAKLAHEITKSLRKNNIPDDAKIAITFFLRDDGVRTPLGIQLSNKLFFQLILAQQKGKISQKILFPENVDKRLDEIMYKYFIVPQGVDESEYWKTFLNNKTPDFYVTGKYKLNSSCTKIQLNEIFIKPDKYGKYKNITCVIDKSISKKITDKNLIKSINKFDISINKPNLYYEKLINIKDNTKAFDLTIYNETSRKVVNDFNFTVGEAYSISLDLYKDF